MKMQTILFSTFASLICVAGGETSSSSCMGAGNASAHTTIALTTTAENATDAQLSKALLVLLEAEATLKAGFFVVERQQIDLILHELIIDKTLSKNTEHALQPGKLSTADLIVSAKLLQQTDGRKRKVFIRMTEPLTGVIRGATVVHFDGVDVEEAAELVMHYVDAVVRSPKTAGLTVSVSPFETEGKFRHVRPLELIVRDVMTEQLRRAGGFQVLQRTDMQSLLTELDLVLAGLTDPEELPETLPSREGVYHIHGTVNERIDGNNNIRMIVEAKLTRTATGEDVLTLRSEFAKEELARSLRLQTSQIVTALEKNKAITAATATPQFDEAQQLSNLAIRDVRRLIRNEPHDHGYIPLIYGSVLPSRPSVDLDSQFGTHLFRKTIDRLETLLFLEPDRTEAQFALAYCYSFHLPGVWNPERSEHLFRQVIFANRDSRVSTRAFRRLNALYVHHHGNHQIKEEDIPRLLKLLEFALTTASAKEKLTYGRYLPWMTKLYLKQGDHNGLLKKVRLCWQRVHDDACNNREYEAKAVATAIGALLKNTDTPDTVKRDVRVLMDEWTRDEDLECRQYAFDFLTEFLLTEEQIEANHLACADQLLQMEDVTEANAVKARVAAEYFIDSDRAEVAIKILNRIDADKVWPDTREKTPYAFKYHHATLGKAYEALQQRTKARDAYLRAAESRNGAVINATIFQKVHRLGGVPLRPDRPIDIQYHVSPVRRLRAEALATDGDQLFCGRPAFNSINGIQVLDLRTKIWHDFGKVPHYVTCLAVQNGFLWAGTTGHGLWKIDLKSGQTSQITEADGLPERTIVSIVVTSDIVYAAVGETKKSLKPINGGVVEIGRDGKASYLGGGNAPPFAPTSMVVVDGQLLVVSDYHVYQWTDAGDGWKTFDRHNRAGRLFHENGRLWAAMATEGVHLKEVKKDGRTYQKDAGDLNHRPTPYFLIDQGDYLWLGGKAWNYFRSGGFYRIQKQSGEVESFGPRDGFAIDGFTDFTCYDGVFARGRIWLATVHGIAEVTIIPTSVYSVR